MKTKKRKYIEMYSSHVMEVDDVTGYREITEFEILMNGELIEWIKEYLDNPLKSRLHKNFAIIFKSWVDYGKSSGA